MDMGKPEKNRTGDKGKEKCTQCYSKVRERKVYKVISRLRLQVRVEGNLIIHVPRLVMNR